MVSKKGESEWSAVWFEAFGTVVYVTLSAGVVAISNNVALEELLPPRLVLIALGRASTRHARPCTPPTPPDLGFGPPQRVSRT